MNGVRENRAGRPGFAHRLDSRCRQRGGPRDWSDRARGPVSLISRRPPVCRMTDLLIQIKKKNDGSAALTCRRADGSVTWQRQDGQQGHFFPLHDLTHYAVETVLGYTRGFFGLVADGWDLADFDKPWPRGRLPTEALLAEFVVGFLDIERA